MLCVMLTILPLEGCQLHVYFQYLFHFFDEFVELNLLSGRV